MAHWARERGWMDYAGEECIPHDASLVEKLLIEREPSPEAETLSRGYTLLGGRA